MPIVSVDPPRGALVNVVGTTNVLEAAFRRGVRGLSHASSAAVYGPDDGGGAYDARSPATLYGVFKQRTLLAEGVLESAEVFRR